MSSSYSRFHNGTSNNTDRRRTNNGSSTNNVVNPNSVHAQFSQLSKDKDTLLLRKTESEQKFKQTGIEINELRQKQIQLSQNLEQIHITLGTQNKKINLLKNEKLRLKNLMQNEKLEIVQINESLQTMQEQEYQHKVRFCKEMDTLNDEMVKGVRKLKEQNLRDRISVESVDRVLKSTILLNCLQKERQEHVSEDNEVSGLETPQDQNHSTINMVWHKFESDLRNAHTKLQESVDFHKNEKQTQDKLKQKLMQFRVQMNTAHGQQNQSQSQQHHCHLNEQELDELERLWEEQQQHNDKNDNEKRNLNGCEELEEQGQHDDKEVEGGQNSSENENEQQHHQKHSKRMKLYQLHQHDLDYTSHDHSNMSLFYDNMNDKEEKNNEMDSNMTGS